MTPKLIIRQKITAFVNRYAIFLPSENNQEELIAFAQQKRVAIKEKIHFYDSEERTNLIFTLRAEKVLDIHGRYFVEDKDGNLIGAFRKNFKKSLLISSWSILDKNDTPIMEVAENNAVLAALRRFIGFIPIIGDLLELIILFFRYHFSFIPEGTTEEAGIYKKTTLFRDHYELLMKDEVYATHDQRVLIAMTVALDAMQSR